MAASNAWDEASPLGSALASSLDEIIRQLKVDIRERMNLDHVFGQNVTDDGKHRSLTIPPAFVVPNQSMIDAQGLSLTGASAVPIVNLQANWNTTGQASGLTMNIADAASHPSSFLLYLLVSGQPVFFVLKTGGFSAANQRFVVNAGGNIVVLNSVPVSFPSANGPGFLSNDGAGTLSWSGSGAGAWIGKSAAYTVVDADRNIDVSAAAGPVTISLKAAPQTGQGWYVYKADGTANIVTVSGNGKNINGQATFPIYTQYENYLFEYQGTEYRVK